MTTGRFHTRLEPFVVSIAVLVVSAILWSIAYQFDAWFLTSWSISNRQLLVLASGVGFFAILIGGLWAAFGISIAHFVFLTYPEGVVSRNSAVMAIQSGFIPYIVLLITCRLSGIRQSLENLLPAHLPLLSLGVATGTALLELLLILVFEANSLSNVIAQAFAMATGSFIGCLLITLSVLMGLRGYRWVHRVLVKRV